jgi:hypothetical protein
MAGYKTYVAAVLVAVFGVLAQTDWISFLNNPTAGLVAIGSAILFAIMRAITNSPAAVQIIVKKPETSNTNVLTEDDK